MRASLAIENFLEMMSAERGAAGNTLESYRRDLEAAADVMQTRGVNLAEAKTEDVRHVLDGMSNEGFAATSQARRLSALRQFFRFLYSEGFRQDDPTGVIDAPKKQKPLPKIMSVENVVQTLRRGKRRNRLIVSRRCVCTHYLKHFMQRACVSRSWSRCQSVWHAPIIVF
jgi:integrase/recombinase XerD